MARRRVLVIGGGFAGLEIAMRVSGELDVTVVDAKEYFEYAPGILRGLVRPEFLRLITRAYVDIAARFHFRFLQGWVEELTESAASVRSGESVQQLPFDFAAICCGCGYSEPIRPRKEEIMLRDRQVNVEEWYQDIKQSRSPLIIGGGTVGVELAGEILAHFPGKPLTLVTLDPRLMRELPEAASEYTQAYLTGHGLKVIYGRPLTEEEKKEHDLVFMCAGVKTQTQFMAAHFGQALNPKGAIIVNKCLQVQGCEHIFSAGDCCITPIAEGKTAYFAKEMGKLAARNLLAAARSERLQELPELSHFPLLSFVSLGPSFGVTVFNSLVLGGRLQGWIKEKWEQLTMAAFSSTPAASIIHLGYSSVLLGNKLVG